MYMRITYGKGNVININAKKYRSQYVSLWDPFRKYSGIRTINSQMVFDFTCLMDWVYLFPIALYDCQSYVLLEAFALRHRVCFGE